MFLEGKDMKQYTSTHFGDDSLKFSPYTVFAINMGRDLHIYVDEELTPLRLKYYFTPLRIFYKEEHVRLLEHRLYFKTSNREMSSKALEILHRSRKLKYGKVIYFE